MTLGHLDKNYQKLHKNDPLGVSVFQKSFFLKRTKIQRQHRRNKAQKEVGKSEFSLELVFCIVKNIKPGFTKNTETLMELSNEKLGVE